MVPPKYKFYIAKQLSTVINRGFVISNTTGEISQSDISHSITDKINVLDYDTVRLLTSSYVNCSIAQYDSDNNFLSKTSVTKEINTLHINENTEYIRLQFYELANNITNIIAGGYSVNPHYKTLSKKYTKENQQEFFRISLEGKITLFGTDFEILKNSNLNDQLLLFIDKYKKLTNNYTEYYRGEFSKTDCKLNYDKKSCELKTTAIDAYNNIIDKYENTYDLIKLAPAISKINLHKRSLLQVYVKGANTISNFFGGTYWEDDVNEAIDNHNDLLNKYHFSYVKAGNEFYVKNAGIQEVNGIYAGTNGNWEQWNGHTCYMGTDKPNTLAHIYIKRNSDDVVLYQSVEEYYFPEEGNCYIGRENITMINTNDINDRFIIESPFVYHIYCRMLCDVNAIQNSQGKTDTYDLPIDDFVSDNKNYKKCIGFNGGLFFCTSKAVDEPTKYGMNDYGQYFTDQFIPSSAGIDRPLPISRNSWANASLWYVYDNYYALFEEKLRKQYTLKDSYSIAAVIKALLKKIDPTIKHEATQEYSHFLYSTETPISMARFYVYITQKTNILKGDYDQPAQKAETTLKDIMEMLRDCFRCYWYIEDNKFKIEHISFFMKGRSYDSNNIQLDITKLKDQFNKKAYSYFQSEIEYNKSDLNRRYEFNWMDDATDLFGGLTIDVKSNYIQKDKTENININQFSSDVDFMLFNPSNFSNDGFALLCPIKNGASLELPIIETRLKDENNRVYKAYIQNYYASWAYLVNFYMYDMPAYRLDCNILELLYANDIKMCMEHTVEFPIEEDINELELIKTSVGNGKIDEYSVNLDTRISKIKLIYTPQ